MKIISDTKIDKLYRKVAVTAAKMLEQPHKRLAFGLNFVTATEIRAINLNNRGIDSATDVLSFPTLNVKAGAVIDLDKYPNDYDRSIRALYIGDIVVCEEVACRQAEESGHSVEREKGFLVLHGLLHLLGYDHESKQEEELMRECQRMILKKAGLEI